MQPKVYFTEKQRFTQWWMWLIIAGINGTMAYGIYTQIFCKEPLGDHPMNNVGLLALTGVILLFTFFIFSLRLVTRIQEDGIYIRYIPFHGAYKFYPWTDITKATVRKYSPLREFGGWGVRYGDSGMAYNVSGNRGLQLEFANGKKLLIGTRRPEQMVRAIAEAGY